MIFRYKKLQHAVKWANALLTFKTYYDRKSYPTCFEVQLLYSKSNLYLRDQLEPLG